MIEGNFPRVGAWEEGIAKKGGSSNVEGFFYGHGSCYQEQGAADEVMCVIQRGVSGRDDSMSIGTSVSQGAGSGQVSFFLILYT